MYDNHSVILMILRRSFILFLGFLLLAPCAVISDSNNDQVNLKLKESPRLWVNPDTVLNLKDKLHTPYLKGKAKRLLEDADWLVDAKPIAEGEGGTYQHGTRTIASHLQCLTAAWVLTRKPKYRAAAIRHLGNLMNWRQISCEANLSMPHEKKMFFCLSYGEHAADIGLMYDVFRPDITPEEQKVFFDVLDRFYLKEALRCMKRNPWWVNKEWSNWNGVCAGGMGIMALAFYDDRPECRKLIPFVEKSLGEYFKSYIQNGGGCHEGTGYWNYGMHYAMRYLLSWENATGKKHPALEIKELEKSLNFPLDFTRITFGDNDGWHPTGMFFILAKLLNQPAAALRAATFFPDKLPENRKKRKRLARVETGDNLYAADYIPTEKQMEELRKFHAENKDPVARVYEGIGWGVLADDSAFPTMRLSARGGSSKIAGHGHLDLLSFKCMVNGERMITDQKGFIPSVAFTYRGHHLYTRNSESKSTIFVDGLSCRINTVCDETEVVKDKDILGIRINASSIYMSGWRNQFIGRLFLMVESRYWLIIDTAPGHALESRFHTYADFTRGKDWVLMKKGKEQLMMTFSSLTGGGMQESRGMSPILGRQTQIFRWMSNLGNKSLHVTALNPGSEKLGLEVTKEKDGGYAINVKGAEEYQRTIRVTRNLKLKTDN